MFITARRGRDRGRDRAKKCDIARAVQRSWAALLCLSLVMAPGCDSTAKREPVPNPTPAVQQEASEEEVPALDDDAAEERLAKLDAEITANPETAKGARFPEIRAELEEIANGAAAPWRRASAAMLLGSLYHARGDSLRASGYYQHAAALIPEEAGPWMALASMRAAIKDYEGAIEAQKTATDLDPNNLENWLGLGELRIRLGDQQGAVDAYVSYEQRRKGLINGLTLHDAERVYVTGVDERVECANALAAAADQGTAVALIYSLRTDREPRVRATVARVMGLHRLELYLPVLQTQSKEENDPDAKEAVAWALAEIARDPVKIEATERPRLAEDDSRATEGELPRAAEAPVEFTEDSTLAPAGEATTPVGSAEGEGPAPSAG